MCGICGQISLSGQPVSREAIVAMAAALVHRGPDSSGLHLDEAAGLGLGHRRLSIIDLSGGHQPISSEDKLVKVVCNGEIYNHLELRRWLESRGHHFATRSDNEVIVHLMEESRSLPPEEVGAEVCGHLTGMFAFAAWDSKSGRFLAARDRLGKKPLFLAERGGVLSFASELSALLRALPEKPGVEVVARRNYFKYGYIPSPQTIYAGVEKLPPAHALLVHGEPGARQRLCQRYWELPSEQTAMDESDAAEHLHSLLSQAVRDRLMSDVPLGAFLSGGLDSSIIAALMAKEAGGRIKTCCVGFDDESHDERAFAQATAKNLGTDHDGRLLEWDVRALLPKLAEHFGEPFGDSSALPCWHLCRAARERVTVALSGDGADEILGGYRRYLGRKFLKIYLGLPKLLRSQVFDRLLAFLPEPEGYYGHSLLKQFRLLAEQAQRVEADPLEIMTLPFSEAELPQLLVSDRPGSDPVRDRAAAEASWDAVTQMLRADQQTYLPDDILVKVDRMGMAHSLEVRCPFLDHRVVEFCASLPLGMKLRHFTGKHLLRRVARGLVRPEVLNRPKHGFTAPLERWFREDLRDYAREVTLGLPEADFRRAHIEKLWNEHLSRQRDHSHRLWLLLAWGIWAGKK